VPHPWTGTLAGAHPEVPNADNVSVDLDNPYNPQYVRQSGAYVMVWAEASLHPRTAMCEAWSTEPREPVVRIVKGGAGNGMSPSRT
jgi:hypothetical protein